MLERAIRPLVFTAAIGSGVVGGVFFGFSSFVMPALGAIAPSVGIAAMQQINISVINPSFMGAFLGTAALSLVAALAGLGRRRGGLILAGSLAYLLGCFAVTMMLNVPLNDQLAVAGPRAAAELWPQFLPAWTFWNHVRTAGSLLAAMLFTAALAESPRPAAGGRD